MSAKNVAAAGLALALAGCMDMQSALHYPFLHTEYGRRGFAVSDDARVYRYYGDKNLAVLEVRELRLEDQDSDGIVDRVKSGGLEYVRGEPGTEALFKDMDGLLRDSADFLSVGAVRGKWERKSSEEILDRWLSRPHVK